MAEMAPISTEQYRPMRKQQQRSLVTQQKLLDAAIDAFAENGFKGTSTRDIADRAGVHHPLITYHFKNKNQLWRAAINYMFEGFNAALTDVPRKADEQELKQFVASRVRAYITYAKQQPALHKFLLQECSRPSARLQWMIDTHLRPMFANSIKLIERLQDQGVAPAGNPAMLFSMMRIAAAGLPAIGVELESSCGLDFNSEQTLDELADMIVRVFLPGDTPSCSIANVNSQLQ